MDAIKLSASGRQNKWKDNMKLMNGDNPRKNIEVVRIDRYTAYIQKRVEFQNNCKSFLYESISFGYTIHTKYF